MSTSQSEIEQLLAKGWTPTQIDALNGAYNILNDKDNTVECVDNVRYARAGNKEEVEAYVKAAGDGCCGSSDEIYWSLDGTIILFGYNFGH